MTNERINRVLKQMNDKGLTQLLVSDPVSIRYLTNANVYPGERFYALLLKQNNEHILFMNKLFMKQDTAIKEVWYQDSDNYMDMVITYLDKDKILGVDKDLNAKFLIPIINDGHIKCELGSICVDDTRAIKDEKEIALMIENSLINDEVMKYAKSCIKEGISEKELAALIDKKYLEFGCQKNAFPPICSFGKNGADPHHMPDDTRLQKGDAIVLDIGGCKDNYCSDMTRTYFFKEATDLQKKVHDIVLKANEEAEKIIKPGVRLCDIDLTARNIIANEGYGEYFTHRLGHFIGQSGHEFGDVSSTNTNVVKEGMIFSIEPGIYLPGQFGVRIEDLVLVTKDGCHVLNHVAKPYEIIE